MSMESDNSYFFDHSNQAEFKMAIPVGSLSFKDYMQGCRLAWRSARKRRYWVSPLLIGVASGLAFCFLYYLVCEYLFVMKGFNLFFSGWFDSAEEAEFRVFNARILLIFIYTFFMGYFVRFVLQRLVNKKNHRRIYLANDSIREGYSLELTDKGIRCANRLAGSHISWQKVRGVTSSGEMDFILIGSGMFLWIPSALEGYPRNQALAFIQAKCAEMAEERSKTE